MAHEEPCCARITSQLNHQQAEIRRLARLATRQQARGRRIDGILAQLEREKATLASIKARRVDHDAEHAAEMAVPA